VIDTLTAGRMIPSRTNSPPAEESNLVIFYHWVDTSAGGLLVPEGKIHPVVSVIITRSIPLTGWMILLGTNNPPAEVSTQ
jgi:hypothetical protein